MDRYIFPPPTVVAIPVEGGGQFPVRRIYCVGRNYAAHVREMGGDPDREEPFFFGKPADTVVTNDGAMPYPSATTDLHHEMELVIAIAGGGKDIAIDNALEHVFGYAAGLDMTRRDLQAAAKAAGRPWDMAKGFDHSAPIGQLQRASVIGHPATGAITLTVNGSVRQSSVLDKMIWSVPEIVAYLSRHVRLATGDLIMTGTPEGVAAVSRGDVLVGTIAGVGEVRTHIV